MMSTAVLLTALAAATTPQPTLTPPSTEASPGRSMTAETVLAEMDRVETRIADLSFSFQQEVSVRLTGERQRLMGSALFKRPDRFAIRHTTPVADVAMSDGKTLWLYRPDANQVVVENLKSWLDGSKFPQGLLDFRAPVPGLRKNYDVTYLGEQRGRHHLEFAPRNRTDFHVRVWVSSDTWFPEVTELASDALTIRTEISDLRTNRELEDRDFLFRIPRGAQVLRNLLTPR